MPASLAETLYHRWRRAQHDITAHPAWGNLESEQRLAWEAVAEAGCEKFQPALVGYRCVCGVDHMFETREAAIERLQAELEVERKRTHVCGRLHAGDIGHPAVSTADRERIAFVLLAAGGRVAKVLNDRRGFHVDGLDQETRADLLDAITRAVLG